MLVGNFGVEGVSFEYVDGRPQWTALIADDPRGDGAAQWEFGANGPWPRILMPQIIENRFFGFPQSVRAHEAALRYQVDSFPVIIATADENRQITSLLSDINTYRMEMITRFIIGTEPLSNFDNFVDTINGMGLAELLEIKQVQYDRVTQP